MEELVNTLTMSFRSINFVGGRIYLEIIRVYIVAQIVEFSKKCTDVLNIFGTFLIRFRSLD